MVISTTDEAMLDTKISEGGVQKDSIREQGITIQKCQQLQMISVSESAHEDSRNNKLRSIVTGLRTAVDNLGVCKDDLLQEIYNYWEECDQEMAQKQGIRLFGSQRVMFSFSVSAAELGDSESEIEVLLVRPGAEQAKAAEQESCQVCQFCGAEAVSAVDLQCHLRYGECMDLDGVGEGSDDSVEVVDEVDDDDAFDVGENLEVVIHVGKERKSRFRRCNRCEPCLRDNCETCTMCLDKPRYGGPNTRKKSCLKRKCDSYFWK